MFNKFYFFLISLFITCFSLAQEISLPGNTDNGTNFNVIYKNDISGQAYLYTRGFGLIFHQGRHVTASSRSFYEVDFRTLNHPKQVKLTGEAQDRKRFIYGKLNSVMVAGANLGMQKVLFAKADNKAVEVRYAYSFGPIIAFAKPYYIQVYKNTSGSGKNEITNITFENESFSQDSGRAIGRAPFSKGLSELKFYPGINAKFNMSFEYAPYTNLVRAIETGISLDFYPKALPMMARNPKENLILTLKVGFVFGTKWY